MLRYFTAVLLLLAVGLLLAACVAPPPIASFSIDLSTGNAPLTVQFSDTSQNIVTERLWDFGDGSESTQQHPSHEYTEAGLHTVGLTVTGPGGTDTAIQEGAVHVEPGPPTNMVVNPTQIDIQVHSTVLLYAIVYDQFGNEAAAQQVTWSLTSNRGNIDSDGMFTAGNEAGFFQGLILVTFDLDELVIESLIDVTVRPGPLDGVVIAPSSVTINIGSTQDFNFKAFDAYGNEISGLQALWSLSQPMGNIDTTGRFKDYTKTGVFSGLVVVEVKEDDTSIKATANVTILPGPLFTLTLEPETVTASAGSTISFNVEAYDSYQNPIPQDLLQSSWEASGGSIDSAGVFTTPSEPGLYEVSLIAAYRGQQSTRIAWVAVGTAPGIMVKFTFNGQPLSDFTQAQPGMYLIDTQTSSSTGFLSTYYQSTDTYFIYGISAGSYRVGLTGVDVDGDGLILAGDFQKYTIGPVVTIDAETIGIAQMEVARVIHLTWPFDNATTHPGGIHDPPSATNTFPAGPVMFEWEPLPEASYYTVEVRNPDTGEVIRREVTETEVTVQLEPGEYELSIKAYNAEGSIVGMLGINYTNGWSIHYDFRVN
ncbi:MAG: PKD domain-containing protein [Dehalococcoidales bacterium]|nr:MAG: PKD domain-containing protein [Dehalococcoidales bacterium]